MHNRVAFRWDRSGAHARQAGARFFQNLAQHHLVSDQRLVAAQPRLQQLQNALYAIVERLAALVDERVWLRCSCTQNGGSINPDRAVLTTCKISARNKRSICGAVRIRIGDTVKQ